MITDALKIDQTGAEKQQNPSKPLTKLIRPHFFIRLSESLDILECFFDLCVYSVL